LAFGEEGFWEKKFPSFSPFLTWVLTFIFLGVLFLINFPYSLIPGWISKGLISPLFPLRGFLPNGPIPLNF